jgi:hypothetical protein
MLLKKYLSGAQKKKENKMISLLSHKGVLYIIFFDRNIYLVFFLPLH